MQLGALEYLISVNDKGVKEGIDRSERTIRESASKTDRQIQNFGNKISAWTIAKGQLLANFTERALRSAYSMSKQMLRTAVDSYAQYEQLVGGVDTIFKEASAKVQAYAKKAFMNVGVSANQYMETVTIFANKLIQDLGGDTQEAAEVANMALVDMADNVNKMGTSMESVQNAYRGMSMGNFRMIDNLRLGYNGTRSEMERLMRDAEEWEASQGRTVKYSMDSYADMVKAIHVIQQKLGITGTTEKEANDTISGSMNRLKASWQDLLTTMADPEGDLGTAMDNVAESAETVLHNLIPVFKQTLKSMTKLVKRALPEIGKLFKTDILPAIRDIGKSALQGIKNAFANGGRGILEFLMGDDYNDETTWSDFGKKVIGGIKKGIDTVKLNIATILGLTDENGNPVKIADDATWGDIGTTILDKISKGLEDGGWLANALDNAAKDAAKIAKFAGDFITQLAKWIGENAPVIGTLITNLINAIAQALPDIVNAISAILTSTEFQSAISTLVSSLATAIKDILPDLLQTAKSIWDSSSTEAKVGFAAWAGWKTIKTAFKLFGSNGILHGLFGGSAAGAGAGGTAGIATAAGGGVGSTLAGIIGLIGGMHFIDEMVNTVRGKMNGQVSKQTADAYQADVKADTQRYSSEEYDKLGSRRDALVGLLDLLGTVGSGSAGGEKALTRLVTMRNKGAGYGDIWRPLMQYAPKELGKQLVEQLKAYEQGTYSSAGKDALDTLQQIREALEEEVASIKIKMDEQQAQAELDAMNFTAPVKPVAAENSAESLEEQIGTVEVPANVYLSNFDLGLGMKPFHHAKGAWNVPYDDYPALLHRDEMVLTKSQARRYRDGEMNADYGAIGAMVGTAVEAAMNRVYVMMNGNKVGDLTTKRVKKNMNASSYSKLRAMGG